VRAAGPFIAVDCGAIAEGVLESELFGHARGSFTGATGARRGLFEEATGGTLFLDEVGDIGARIQGQLLRVLQEGEIRRVGESAPIRVDTRVVAATNKDLAEAVKAGRFREDLFYRLNVFRIELPALRERRDDIAALAAYFLREFGQELGKGPLRPSPGAVKALQGYAWPGNVRELRNLMERAAVLAVDPEVGSEFVATLLPPAGRESGEGFDLATSLHDVERKAILRALAATKDNKAEAASLLGIGERTLWTKLKKHGL
jgi:two-component system response regulator HydG